MNDVLSDMLSDVYDSNLCDDVICIIATPTNCCLLIVWTMKVTHYTERSLIKKEALNNVVTSYIHEICNNIVFLLVCLHHLLLDRSHTMAGLPVSSP